MVLQGLNGQWSHVRGPWMFKKHEELYVSVESRPSYNENEMDDQTKKTPLFRMYVLLRSSKKKKKPDVF